MEQFKVEYTETFDEITVKMMIYKEKRRILLVRCRRLTEDGVAAYCALHEKVMNSVSIRKRQLLFVYDLRGTVCDGWASTLKPFIAIHKNYKRAYETCLHATLLVIDFEFVRFLVNAFFTTNPSTRPVEICRDDATMIELMCDVWSRHK